AEGLLDCRLPLFDCGPYLPEGPTFVLSPGVPLLSDRTDELLFGTASLRVIVHHLFLIFGGEEKRELLFCDFLQLVAHTRRHTAQNHLANALGHFGLDDHVIESIVIVTPYLSPFRLVSLTDNRIGRPNFATLIVNKCRRH